MDIRSLRRSGANALSILTSDVMNRATSFVMYALVARHLGTREFGQLSVAFSLFYLFQVFAVAGLKTLIIRQVSQNLTQTRLYFVNGCMIVALSSLVSLAALFALVRVLHYPSATSLIILLLALGLFPCAVSAVCEAIFQAWEEMRLIAWVNVPANVAKITATFLLLSRSRSLFTIVIILLSSLFSVAAVEVYIVLRRLRGQQGSLNAAFSLATLRSGLTFLGIDGAIAIESSLNVLLLSKLAGETQVGLYSAATQTLVPLLLVYQSIAQSIFPVMCRKVGTGFQSLKRITVQVVEVLLILALPAVAGLSFFGPWAIAVFYRNPEFLQAVPALRIIAWMLVLQVFSSVLGQVLLADHREKLTLRIVVVDTLVNVVVGWPLIAVMGVRGAAITVLMTKGVGCIQHYIPVSRLFAGFPLGRVVWRPIVATACVAVYLSVAGHQTAIVTGVFAILIYGAALLSLAVLAAGGLRQFLNMYLLPEAHALSLDGECR